MTAPAVTRERRMVAYRYRLRVPGSAQRRALAQHAGAARYAYNWGIARIKAGHDAYTAAKDAGEPTAGLIPDHFALCRAWTEFAGPVGAKNNGMWWTTNVASSTFQASLRNAHVAFKNFVDSRTRRRKGRAMGYPRFKSKRSGNQAFPLFGGGSVAGPRVLRLPKIGDVHTYESTRKLRRVLDRVNPCDPCTGTGVCGPCRGDGYVACPNDDHAIPASCRRCKGELVVKCRDCKGARGANKPAHGYGTGVCGTCKGEGSAASARIVSINVSRTPAGSWYASLVCEVDREIRQRPLERQRRGGRIGIDLSTVGLTLSTGDLIEHPRALAGAAARMKHADRVLSRRTRRDDAGHVIMSRRREHARIRRARLSERVANVRRDWIDQTATALIHGVRPGTQHTQLRGISGHTSIVVEGFDLQALAQQAANDTTVPVRVRRARNRGMTDLSAGEFRTRLALRSGMYATTVELTSKTAASGRTCSRCGVVKTKPIPPWQTEFRCDACGYSGPRRLNTALALARGNVPSDPSSGGDDKPARGDPVRPTSPRPHGHGRGHGSVKRVTRPGNHAGQPQSTQPPIRGQGKGAAGTPGRQLPGVHDTHTGDPPPTQPGLW